MSMTFHCPECRAPLRLPDGPARRRGKCPKCGQAVTLIAPEQNPASKPTSSSPESAPPPEPFEPPAPRKRRRRLTFGLLLILASAAVAAGWQYRTDLSALLNPVSAHKPLTVTSGVEPPSEPPIETDIEPQNVQLPVSPAVTIEQPEPAPPRFEVTDGGPEREFVPQHKMTGQRPEARQLTGTWVGIYYSFPDFHAIEITWNEPAPAAAASMHAEMTGTARHLRYRGMGPVRPGAVPEGGQFHDFQQGTATGRINRQTQELQVVLSISDDPHRPPPKGTHLLSGVVSQDPPAFASTFLLMQDRTIEEVIANGQHPRHRPHLPLLVMAPQEGGGAALLESALNLNALGKSHLKQSPPGRLSADPARLSAIDQWIQRFRNEYPDISLRQTELGQLCWLTSNLFADEPFRAAFGTRFDDLTPQQCEQIGWLMIDVRRKSVPVPPNIDFSEYGPIQQQFMSGGSNGRAATLAHVWPRRVIRQWLRERREELTALEPYPGVLAHLTFCKAAFHEQLIDLFPSEQDQQSILSETTARVSPAVFEHYVAELLTWAPSSMTIAALVNWKTRSPAPLEYLNDDDLARFEPLITGRIEQILPPLLQAEADKLADLPHTKEGLPAIQSAYFQTRRKFEAVRDDPRLIALANYNQELHGWIVSQHRTELLAELAAASSEDDLLEFERLLFAMPDGLKAADAQEFRAAVQARHIELARNCWRARFSSRELALMDENDRIVVPETCEPPTAQEVKLAHARSHADVMGVMTGPATFEYGTKMLLLIPNSRPIPTGRIAIHVLQVELLGDPEPLPGIPCGYRLQYRTKMVPELLGGNPFDKDGKVTAALGALMTGAGLASWNDPQTEEFVLTDSGWKSPSVSLRLSLEGPVLLGKLLNALTSETDSETGR